MLCFISYKREDQTFAERVRDTLRSWGYSTWMDIENIPQGAYWPDEIDRGLRQSDLVVGLLSPGAINSRNVRNEWDWAISAGKKLVLLMLRPVPPEEIPHRLVSINYIDCTADMSRAFGALQTAITSPDYPQYAELSEAFPGAAVIAIPQARPTEARTDTKTPTGDPNRSTMIRKVRDHWINGVLNHVLRDSAFEIDMAVKSDAVIKHVDYGEIAMPTSAGILKVFDDMRRDLLILGAPGAGKTVLMLQLARELLNRAEANESSPIPVILNLSSWADKHLPLADWLIERLSVEYQVSRVLAQRWIENEKLLPLLDGLDEVRLEQRDACVQTINAFRARHRTVDMVVCSRIEDYEQLSSRLNLQGALLLHPLTDAQVDAELDRHDMGALRQVMAVEPELRSMAYTPFLLNTMIFTYAGATQGEVEHFDIPKDRLNHLFDHYTLKHFQLTPREDYTLAQTRHWLGWMADGMMRLKQSVFFIETLGADWLEDRQLKRQFLFLSTSIGTLIATISGLLLGVAVGIMLNVPMVGAIFGGLSGGVLGCILGYWLSSQQSIRPAERIVWRWSLKAFGLGALTGVTIGIIIGIISAGVVGQAFGISAAVMYGLIIGASAIVALGFERSETVEARTRPNEGMRDTLVNVLAYGVIIGILFALISGAVLYGSGAILVLSPKTFPRAVAEFLSQLLSHDIMTIILVGFGLGFGSGLGFAAAFGGMDILVRHIALRIVLYRAGCMPRSYAHFLDFCTEHVLLRKVGGGYIFPHRMMLEYFAEQYSIEGDGDGPER